MVVSKCDQPRHRVDPDRHPEDQVGEVEEPRVLPGHQAGEDCPEAPADGHAHDGDEGRQQEVVDRHLDIGIAERLQQPDLRPVERHDPADDHAHEKRRDGEEDGRHHHCHALQLVDLGGDETVADLG
jgi:hypothetical protein